MGGGGMGGAGAGTMTGRGASATLPCDSRLFAGFRRGEKYMDALAAVSKGLWNLGPAERREVYRDLRREFALSESEPMIALPEPALKAWSQRFAVLLAQKLAQHPLTRVLADVSFIESTLMGYGQAATDAFLDSHQSLGEASVKAGLPGLYIHVVLNAVASPISRQAAREVLLPEHAALVEARYPTLMLLRHALMQEAVLGARAA
jgi:hypothetical protein